VPPCDNVSVTIQPFGTVPFHSEDDRVSELIRDITGAADLDTFEISGRKIYLQLAQCWFPELASFNDEIHTHTRTHARTHTHTHTFNGPLTALFPMMKYKYIFEIRYTEAILSNSTRRLLWFEITKMLIAV